MANVNSITNASASSSLYGSRNVISGLASGMDTEAMIENSISGYKEKIKQLNQDQAKVEWKQESIQSIIDQSVGITNQFASYTSSTNLMSASFFNSTNTTTVSGTHASQVAAAGQSTSRIQVYSASEATAATYMVSAAGSSVLNGSINTTTDAINLGGGVAVNNYEGTLTISYGENQSFSFSLAEREKFATNDAAGLAEVIRSKLKDITVYDDLRAVKASEYFDVSVSGSSIQFKAKKTGEAATIKEASGKLADKVTDGSTSFSVSGLTSSNTALRDYIQGKTLTVSYDGQSKKITLDKLAASATVEDLARQVQNKIAEAFAGSSVSVSSENGGLKFDVGGNHSLEITSDLNDLLGMPQAGLSSFANTRSTLGELFGSRWDSMDKTITINGKTLSNTFTKDSSLQDVMNAINNGNTGVTVSYSKLTSQFVFTTTETGSIQEIKLGGMAKSLFGTPDLQETTVADALGISFEGTKTLKSGSGADEYRYTITSSTTLRELAEMINQQSNVKYFYNEDSGMYEKTIFGNVSSAYEEAHKKFTIDGRTVQFADIFGRSSANSYSRGQDAAVELSINGGAVTKYQRSSNTIELDGMTVTLNGAFSTDTSKGEVPVTFGNSVDSDKVVNAVKSFVEDFNKLATSVRAAFTTQPARKSDGSSYNPLTEDDKNSMSESAVKEYEEMAKQGLLFGDSDLSSMYNKLIRQLAPDGATRQAMADIGLTTTFKDGITTLVLDEKKMRESLKSGTEKVQKVFSDTAYGANDGLVGRVKRTVDMYTATSSASPGILVRRAGTKLSPISLLNNTMQKQLDRLQEQIERWETKMSSRVDYYTKQFTKLEQLMNTMNNQSSMIAGMMGG